MATKEVYLLFLILYHAIDARMTFRSHEASIKLSKYVTNIGTTSQGRCRCETCEECVCTVDGNEYVTDATWAAIVMQDFNRKDKPIASIKWPPTQDPLDVSESPSGHPLLRAISGKLEPLLHLKLYPDTSLLKTTKFLLYDRFDFKRSFKAIHYNKEETIKSLPAYEKMFVVIHGWLGSPGDQHYVDLREALIDYKPHINPSVVMVDWTYGAQFNITECSDASASCVYNKAAANTILVGRQVGLLSYLLVKLNQLVAHKIHYIGHGLGAQVAHFAAKWFEMLQREYGFNDDAHLIGRISALDPFPKHFQGYEAAYVKKDDATFVDVIHTSSVQMGGSPVDTLRGLFGMSISVGDIDFYPNGGQKHPMCSGIRGPDKTCFHMTAVKYFTASLLRNIDSKQFRSVPCESWDDMDNCRKNSESRDMSSMGIEAQEYNSRGDHFISISGKALSRDLIDEQEAETNEEFDMSESNLRRLSIPPVALHPDDHPLCGMYAPKPDVKREQSSGRIFEGGRAYLGQFPWMVGMYRERPYAPSPYCGGSIIAPHWILTAAHCFSDQEQYSMSRFVIGITDVEHNTPIHLPFTLIKEDPNCDFWPNFFPYPGYGTSTCKDNTDDIALIRLNGNLILPEDRFRSELINRVCLWTRPKFIAGDQFSVSGFGHTYEAQVKTNKFLRWTTGERISKAECTLHVQRTNMTMFMERFDLTSRICGSNNNPPYPGTCSGDSGSPSVVYHNAGHRYFTKHRRAFQVGVVEQSYQCRKQKRLHDIVFANGTKMRRARPNFYVNVGHYLDWIRRTIDFHG